LQAKQKYESFKGVEAFLMEDCGRERYFTGKSNIY
jgi:hypothetical protein